MSDIDEVIKFVRSKGRASCHDMMREFNVSYAKTVDWMDTLEDLKVVPPIEANDTAGPRPLLNSEGERMQIPFQQPFDARQYEPSTVMPLIPAGDYPVRIIAAEVVPTNDGASGMLKVTMEVIGPQHTGHKLFWNLNLFNTKSQQAVDIAYRQMSALCHVIGVFQIADTQQLVNGVPFIAVVSNDGQYNNIKGVKDQQGNAPGKGGQPAAAAPPQYGQPQPQTSMFPPAATAPSPYGPPQAPAAPGAPAGWSGPPQAPAAPGAPAGWSGAPQAPAAPGAPAGWQGAPQAPAAPGAPAGWSGAPQAPAAPGAPAGWSGAPPAMPPAGQQPPWAAAPAASAAPQAPPAVPTWTGK